MVKKGNSPAIVTEPIRSFEGICSACGHSSTTYDWDGNMKTAPFGQMYCSYCKCRTPHSNIKLKK